MTISYNWLKDYLKFDISPEQLSVILTDIGLEVDSMTEWESVKGGLRGVVVGEVITCVPHPNSDHLSKTTVDVGADSLLNVVCGAPNVAAGQKVLCATIGTTIYMGDSSFEIKKSKIRGELSEGMLCAEDELGLGSSHDGIMVLDSSAKVGTPAAQYCNVVTDTIFEIGLTPNRIDCGSHYGVARDIAIYLNINGISIEEATLPSVDNFVIDNTDNVYEVEVEDSEACPRYSGITISGVTIAESPEWLKNKLRAVGLNPINNVVDITNYVQFETGHPLHSFDADMIDGKRVVVKCLPANTPFVTLDGVEHKLSAKDLIICNATEGMCIAGVFGGLKSGVSAATTNIFLESAYFNPVSVRKTSRRHALQTDSSFRFERGVDPDSTIYALKRAAMLIRELGGGKISSPIVDVYPVPIKNRRVAISFERIDSLVGRAIAPATIEKILTMMQFVVVEKDSEGMVVDVPNYKVDVSCEADIVEEILRIYGYNNIDIDEHVNSILSYTDKPNGEKLVNIVSDMLSASGFSEIMCNSLNPAAFYEDEAFDRERLVVLSNPLSSDLNAMRQSLLFGGLTSVARNVNRQNHDLKFYEFGNVYSIKQGSKDEPLSADSFVQNRDLDIFITGNYAEKHWNREQIKTDFFYLKTIVEKIFARLGVSERQLSLTDCDKKYYDEAISIAINNKIVAELGSIDRRFAKKFDIDQTVYYAHIDWDLLVKIIRKNRVMFSELPKYPQVRRDLALLVNKGVKFSQIADLAYRCEKQLLRKVDLFDVYQSDTLGADMKSYAVSFILRDDNGTLTDKNIDRIMNGMINTFEKNLGAKIR